MKSTYDDAAVFGNERLVIIGLGWDPADKRGLFSGPNIDCDASVLLQKLGIARPPQPPM